MRHEQGPLALRKGYPRELLDDAVFPICARRDEPDAKLEATVDNRVASLNARRFARACVANSTTRAQSRRLTVTTLSQIGHDSTRTPGNAAALCAVWVNVSAKGNVASAASLTGAARR